MWTPCATWQKTAKIPLTSIGGTEAGGVGVVDFHACLSSLFSVLLGKKHTEASFHITQVSLRSLAGF